MFFAADGLAGRRRTFCAKKLKYGKMHENESNGIRYIVPPDSRFSKETTHIGFTYVGRSVY